MSNFDELRDILTILLTQRFAPMPRFVRGLMGDGRGRVRDPENPDTHVLVRPNRSASETFSVFNKLVPPVDGTPILIGELPWQPGLTQVVGIDWQAYPYGDWSGYAGVAPHGPTHEWGDAHVGPDAFTVYTRQLGPLRTYSGGSGSMSVYLAPYEYDRWGEGVSWVGLPGLDLSPARPATGTARLMLTYLDLENNVPGVVTGTLDVYSDAVELPRPSVPTGTWEPSAWVRLYGGQSTISEVNDIWDARVLLGRLDSPTGPAGGDLTGAYPDPIVWGLFGNRIAEDAPNEGEVLMYTGSFWRPHPLTAQPPTGPASGDLTGTYPAPWVAGIYNHPYGGEDPDEYDVLMYTGSAWRPHGLRVAGITRTVGGNKQHGTPQKAINWFKGRFIVADCYIVADEGSWDEGLDFSGLSIADGAKLILRGDTRVLAGISYVDGADCNQAGLTNGGDGVVTLATNGARDEITVTMVTTNPDFDADGWGSGDDILVYADDGVLYERTINSISPGGAGNNVIELTVTLPAGASLGNDGTAICLLPNRAIARTVAGQCIYVDGVRGILIDGFYLDTHTGADCHGVEIVSGAFFSMENTAVRAEDFGLFLNQSKAICNDGACSFWDCARGIIPTTGSQVRANYAVVIACSTSGFHASDLSYVQANYTIGANCGSAYYSALHSFVNATFATARQNTTGYYANTNATVTALATNANNNGNGVDYNPAPGAIPGTGNGNSDAIIVVS